jgi:small-conductance mechanosensitive channel
MTYKEWVAVIQLVGLAVLMGWLGYEVMNGGLRDGTVAVVAAKLAWAVLAIIVFNIVATIVVTIIVSIVQRQALKDEKDDERDQAIIARSSRNAYFVTSLSAGACLVLLALGVDPVLGAYALFGAPMLGGAADAVSRLVYYRIG